MCSPDGRLVSSSPGNDEIDAAIVLSICKKIMFIAESSLSLWPCLFKPQSPNVPKDGSWKLFSILHVIMFFRSEFFYSYERRAMLMVLLITPRKKKPACPKPITTAKITAEKKKTCVTDCIPMRN